MKRKLVLLSVLAICVAILSLGSLAYFTGEAYAHNVITSGSVEIELLEWADEAKQIPFEKATDVMPNTSVTKIAEVKNVGSGTAWVRVRVDKTIQLVGEGEPDTELIELDINSEFWSPSTDGEWYYYNEVLQPGETTEPLFTSVFFNAEMGNAYQNATATVDVTAQAVQTANNGETAVEASGWPEA